MRIHTAVGRRHTRVFWSVRGTAPVRRVQRPIHPPDEILSSLVSHDPFNDLIKTSLKMATTLGDNG